MLGFPGLTTKAVQHHLLPSTATIKGHMHREPKYTRSTTKSTEHQTTNESVDITPVPDYNAPCKLFCFAALANTIDHTIYSDLTGKFPIWSYKGNQYIFLTYVYDANEILV